MRVLALALLLLLCPWTAGAEDPPAARSQICDTISNLAGAIMEGRQAGTEMADMIKVGQSSDPSVIALRESLIVAAYEQPRFSSEEYRQRAIADFKNSVYLQCFKSRKQE